MEEIDSSLKKIKYLANYTVFCKIIANNYEMKSGEAAKQAEIEAEKASLCAEKTRILANLAAKTVQQLNEINDELQTAVNRLKSS